MSKSIYEEVLGIIDRNIFELPKGFAVLYEIRKKIEQAQKQEIRKVWNGNPLTYPKKTIKALEQAQKQEKLLELYKEINNKRKEVITLARYNNWSWKLDIEINAMQDKIKELENE